MTPLDHEDCSATVNAFVKLQSNQSQRRALQDLVKSLTHQQVRDLRSMLEEVTLSCDIVVNAPFEISVMILQYLPLHQVFQAQRVSRKWREVLASPRIVMDLVRPWFPDFKPLSDSPNGPAETSAACLEAEHIDAYQRGKAFSMTAHMFKTFSHGLNSDCVAYANGVVARTDVIDNRVCTLLDLKTGTQTRFMTEDRSMIRHLALSSSMIAAMSSFGKCYIWVIREQKSMSLTMPSARVMKVLLSNTSLVVLFRPEFKADGARVEIVTWTLNSQRTHSFILGLNATSSHSLDLKYMLDKDGASVLILERSFSGTLGELEYGELEYIYYKRATLTGVILAQGVVENPGREHHDDLARRTILAQTNQHATIWAYVESFRDDKSSCSFVRVRYNFARDRVEFDTHVLNDFHRGTPMSNIFFFKNAAYYRSYFTENDSVSLQVIDFDRSISTHAPMSTWVSPEAFRSEDDVETPYSGAIYRPDSLLVGDEDFLVVLLTGGILAWSFDKDVKMATENASYTLARDRAMMRTEPIGFS